MFVNYYTVKNDSPNLEKKSPVYVFLIGSKCFGQFLSKNGLANIGQNFSKIRLLSTDEKTYTGLFLSKLELSVEPIEFFLKSRNPSG